MKPILLFYCLLIFFYSCKVEKDISNILTDNEGNNYKITTIGNQIWMAENLRSTKYSDGTSIQNVTDSEVWTNLIDNNTDKAYCYYNNNLNDEKDTLGVLYTFSAAINGTPSNYNIDIQGVCPSGWHIPSHSEWKQLEMYLGMSVSEADTSSWRGTNEGEKLKATFGWKDNGNGTDEFGFSALPGGYCSATTGTFENKSRYGYYWSSTEDSENKAWCRYMYYKYSEIGAYPTYKSLGISVRCIKDK